MITKCIVVHLADDPRYRVRLNLAVDLAKRFDAHLNVVYATANVDMPAGAVGRAVSMEYLTEASEVAHDHAVVVEREARTVCDAQLRSWEWHVEEGKVEKIVSHFAHVADLVIAEQAPHSYFEDRVIFHMSDHVVMSAGSPMLLVPEVWDGTTVGRRILIAWKNGREAIGAVRGGLDFLSHADQIFVLAAKTSAPDEQGGADLLGYLKHHGLTASLVGVSERGGDDILRAAKDHACDMIIMGAYAHSRLREMFMGGATDMIMRHATVPVLMRH